ncbi:nuclear transport factor 2 family protein [Rhodococcus sp. H36-A4]|uniref:nuclear transport factor 2 family protein n=1 Tax=Rhodococcus sp. H36-A4 TaxID=3004353 RepID=UPI0022AF86DA|nr:nuclear transport factor 2 family protein [Rhodococcus sp. H36-A4]MCZ4079308.1 nuclear transport factor 2 family protein [Rhodococcus sp. H36-A4]
MTPTEVTREKALSTVNQYLTAIADATSTEQIAILYAEGATVQDPVGSDPICGRKAIAAFFTPLIHTRRETELLNFRHSGDSAAFHFRVRTYTADGVVTIEPFDVMTFDVEGHITSTKAYWSPEDVRMS